MYELLHFLQYHNHKLPTLDILNRNGIFREFLFRTLSWSSNCFVYWCSISETWNTKLSRKNKSFIGFSLKNLSRNGRHRNSTQVQSNTWVKYTLCTKQQQNEQQYIYFYLYSILSTILSHFHQSTFNLFSSHVHFGDKFLIIIESEFSMQYISNTLWII